MSPSAWPTKIGSINSRAGLEPFSWVRTLAQPAPKRRAPRRGGVDSRAGRFLQFAAHISPERPCVARRCDQGVRHAMPVRLGISRRPAAWLCLLLGALGCSSTERPRPWSGWSLGQQAERAQTIEPPAWAATGSETPVDPWVEREALQRQAAQGEPPRFALAVDRGPGGDWLPDAPAGDWKYVVLHHSASELGSVATIDADHRQRVDREGRAWQGIGYHFLIGNGRGMDDGEVAPTFRWLEQRPGAHAGDSEYNRHGIGICLVGDFERSPPTARQQAACQDLLDHLVDRYDIDRRQIVGHAQLKATACPGRLFPLAQVAEPGGGRQPDPVLSRVWQLGTEGPRIAGRPASPNRLR